ncbi:flavodoxin family protein [Pectinatus haikarae]|uniref:Flavodoxin n=1 Tax=Pectinatus haikarae TaxID=349096 RepID=A0ABT9Y6Z0_9FIRM|nr:flavodoxin family protein [Pectinatus haikarae]MDQ0202992.1 flavodoxin [Pectinatus haikarae]
MKTLIVYSSKTGNTKKVAEAIAEKLKPNCDIYPIGNQPYSNKYDLIIVGYWVDKARPDKESAAYLSSLKGEKVAIFATLGSDPHSAHASESLNNGRQLIDPSNQILGTFICQGKVELALIKSLVGKYPIDHPHGQINNRWMALYNAASIHPNAEDLKKAQQLFFNIEKTIDEN